MLYRTLDIHSLLTDRGAMLYTKDSVPKISRMVYKTLPVFSRFETQMINADMLIGQVDLFSSNVRIGFFRKGEFDMSGLLFCKTYDAEYEEEIIEAISNMLYEYLSKCEGGKDVST